MSKYRRMLLGIMAEAIPTERLVYSLSDYTCDGTVNTFIDTGIRLFSSEYEAFRIELEYDNFDLETQVDQETILECKSYCALIGNAYGLSVRAGRTTDAGKLAINLVPLADNKHYKNASSASVSITYTGGSDNIISVNGNASTHSGVCPVFANTLTIGGRYASANTPDRFVSCHIISLKVYVTPVSTGNTIYSLRDYTCDGTAATAINTGIYLFDQTVYPTGWMISFDLTIGENNVGNGSYLRCRNSASPYPGIALRRDSNNANNLQGQVNSTNKTISAAAGTRHQVSITNDLSFVTLIFDGTTTGIRQGTPANVISPLVIGGELSNDTTQEWNTSRFGKIYIHSLIIKAL